MNSIGNAGLHHVCDGRNLYLFYIELKILVSSQTLPHVDFLL